MEPEPKKKDKPGRGPEARLKGQLLAYYQQHNPDKMKEVQQLASDWVGREMALWKTLRDKYEPVLDGDESSDLMLALQTVRAQSVPGRESKQSPSTSKVEETAAAAKQIFGRTAQMLRRGAQRQKEKLVSKSSPKQADKPKPDSKPTRAPMDPAKKVGILARVSGRVSTYSRRCWSSARSKSCASSSCNSIRR
jgi:hypothetical protein